MLSIFIELYPTKYTIRSCFRADGNKTEETIAECSGSVVVIFIKMKRAFRDGINGKL